MVLKYKKDRFGGITVKGVYFQDAPEIMQDHGLETPRQFAEFVESSGAIQPSQRRKGWFGERSRHRLASYKGKR